MIVSSITLVLLTTFALSPVQTVYVGVNIANNKHYQTVVKINDIDPYEISTATEENLNSIYNFDVDPGVNTVMIRVKTSGNQKYNGLLAQIFNDWEVLGQTGGQGFWIASVTQKKAAEYAPIMKSCDISQIAEYADMKDALVQETFNNMLGYNMALDDSTVIQEPELIWPGGECTAQKQQLQEQDEEEVIFFYEVVIPDPADYEYYYEYYNDVGYYGNEYEEQNQACSDMAEPTQFIDQSVVNYFEAPEYVSTCTQPPQFDHEESESYEFNAMIFYVLGLMTGLLVFAVHEVMELKRGRKSSSFDLSQLLIQQNSLLTKMLGKDCKEKLPMYQEQLEDKVAYSIVVEKSSTDESN